MEGLLQEVLPLLSSYLYINELPLLRLVCRSLRSFIDDEAELLVRCSPAIVFPAHWDCSNDVPLPTPPGNVKRTPARSVDPRLSGCGEPHEPARRTNTLLVSRLPSSFFRRILAVSSLPQLEHLIIFSSETPFLRTRVLKQLLVRAAPSLKTLEFLDWLFNVDCEGSDKADQGAIVFEKLERLFIRNRAQGISSDSHIICGILRGGYFPVCRQLWLSGGQVEDDVAAFMRVMPKLQYLSISHALGDSVSGVLRRLKSESQGGELEEVRVAISQHPQEALRLPALLEQQNRLRYPSPLQTRGSVTTGAPCRLRAFSLSWDEGTIEDLVNAPRQTRMLFPGSVCILEGRVLLSGGQFPPGRASEQHSLVPWKDRGDAWLERLTVEEPPLRINFELSDCKVWGHFSTHHSRRLRAYGCLIGVSTTGLPTVEIAAVRHCCGNTEKDVTELLTRLGPQRPFVLHMPHPLDGPAFDLLSTLFRKSAWKIIGIEFHPAEVCQGRQSYGEWLKLLWNCCNSAAGDLRILRLGLMESSFSWATEDDFVRARQKCVIGEVLQMLPAVRIVETRRFPATYQISRFEWMQSSLRRDVPFHWETILASRGFRRIPVDAQEKMSSSVPRRSICVRKQ